PKAVLNIVQGNQVNAVKASEKEFIDSGCSRHMTGNMSYLSKYEEIDVDILPLEEILMEVKSLVKVKSVQLLDESQVLLRVPRKDNMYSVDLKNVAPLECLTCLFAKATLDEYNLWHRILGHVNFKTINKLIQSLNHKEMSTSKTYQQSLADDGSETRPSMLERDSYIPWARRFR
nr:hypothetical protein [Tanacetum cinerariifolium]